MFPANFPREELRRFASEHELNTFFLTLIRSGYLIPLSNEPSVTFFAPNDQAFKRMDQAYRSRIWHDPEALTDLMLAHIALEELSLDDLQGKDMIWTAEGKAIQVTVIEGTTFLGTSIIISPALESPLGVVYILNSLLSPED